MKNSRDYPKRVAILILALLALASWLALPSYSWNRRTPPPVTKKETSSNRPTAVPAKAPPREPFDISKVGTLVAGVDPHVGAAIHEGITEEALKNVATQTGKSVADLNLITNLQRGVQNTDITHQFDSESHFDDSSTSELTQGLPNFRNAFAAITSRMADAKTNATNNPEFLHPHYSSFRDIASDVEATLNALVTDASCVPSLTCPTTEFGIRAAALAPYFVLPPPFIAPLAVNFNPDPHAPTSPNSIFSPNPASNCGACGLLGPLNQTYRDIIADVEGAVNFALGSHCPTLGGGQCLTLEQSLGAGHPLVQRLKQQRDALRAYHAWQDLGHAFHATQDFFAHSNYVELMAGVDVGTSIRRNTNLNPENIPVPQAFCQFDLNGLRQLMGDTSFNQLETGAVFTIWLGEGDYCLGDAGVLSFFNPADPVVTIPGISIGNFSFGGLTIQALGKNPNPPSGFHYGHYRTSTTRGLNKDNPDDDNPADPNAPKGSHVNHEYARNAAVRASEALWRSFLQGIGELPLSIAITCPADIVQAADPGKCSAVVSFPTPAVTGGCATIICSPAAGSTFPKGVTTVTCTATDASSNTAQCTFTVTVNDTEAPVITCPPNNGVFAASSDCLPPTNSAYTGTTPIFFPSGNGLSGGNFIHQFSTCDAPPAATPGATTTKTLNAVYGGTITISPNAPMPFQAPAVVTVKTDFNHQTGNTRFFDTEMLQLDLRGGNLPAGVMIRESPTRASTGGTNITDMSGGGFRVDSFFDIFVELSVDGGQNWNPGVDGRGQPVALHVEAVQTTDSNECGATGIKLSPPTATDNCDAVTPSCTPPSGSTFPKGVTTVVCTATDTSNNMATCSFTVTIVDLQSPTIVCPANVTKSTDPNQCSAVVTYTTPTPSDNCPGATAACSPASGSTFQKGTTTVTCTATDTSGNTAQCSFTVTVNDTQMPSIACPANITKPTDPDKCSAVVTYTTPTPSDNCPGATAACSPASGSTFQKGTTTVTCTATDTSGNTAQCSFTVTVNDTQPPVFPNGCPGGLTVAAQASCPFATSTAVSFTAPAATDNCPGVAVVCNPPSGSMFPVGTTTVTCTATDGANNTAQCTFAVNAFSFCLQDESNAGIVVFVNAITGDFLFCSNGAVIATGRGTVTVRGCSFDINGSKGDRKVHIQGDTSANSGKGAGTAVIQKMNDHVVIQITDRDMSSNTCSCSR